MKREVTFWGLLRVAVPLILYYILGIAVSGIVMQKLQPMNIVLIMAVAGVPFLGIMYYRDMMRRRDVRLLLGMLPLKIVSWTVIGSMALALLLNNLIALSPLIHWSEGYAETAELLYTGDIWMELAGAGLAAAVLEELLMRGLVYGRLRDMMSARAAIFWSALIFGIFHGNIVQGVYAFLMGIFLAWLYERFGTLWITILAHMSANVFSVCLTEIPVLGELLSGFQGFLAGNIFCIVLAVGMFHVLRPEPEEDFLTK